MCSENEITDVSFIITKNYNESLQLEFVFQPSSSNFNGRFIMVGDIDGTGSFQFRPQRWVQQLSGYSMVSLSGEHLVSEDSLVGTIDYPRCKNFEVYRDAR